MGEIARLPFLIVGGGIGGLAAALALSRKGFAARVLEQASELRDVGAGIQLGPNMLSALDRIGLREAVVADAWHPGAQEMRCALGGQRITRIPLSDAFIARFGERYAVTHRADLHAAILHAARSAPDVKLETGRRVVAYEGGDRTVSAIMEDGQRVPGCAIIGADGLWSPIRHQMLGDGPPRISGHIAYRAVLARADVPDGLWSPDVVLWAGPGTHLVHYPLRRGELFNLVAVFHSDRYVEGWNAEGEATELMSRFRGQRPEVLRLLEKIETWRMWVLCDREPVRNWTAGRAVLIGDAAHPMLQYLAQGAAMAVEDAVRLADEVADRPDDLAGAFRAYQDARYLRAGRVQIMSRVYGEFYHAAGMTAELRDQMLEARTPQDAYDGVAWLYGGP